MTHHENHLHLAPAGDEGSAGSGIGTSSPVCIGCGRGFAPGEDAAWKSPPLCEDCLGTYRFRKLPVWLPILGLAVIAIVAIGIAVNGKYYRAWFDVKRAAQAFTAHDLPTALENSEHAARLLPKHVGIASMHHLFSGLTNLYAERNEAAIADFQAYLALNPGDSQVMKYLHVAEIGLSFSAGDYEAMLEASGQLWSLDKENLQYVLQLASSMACIYVSKGDMSWKTQAEQILAQAEAGASLEELTGLRDYIDLIKYRMRHKVIISSGDFAALSGEERK